MLGGETSAAGSTETSVSELNLRSTRSSTKQHRILVLFFFLSVVTYLDRVNISIASPSILREFAIDRIQMGMVFSAFVAGYMLFQIPGGWLGDRFGHKNSLTIALLWWSTFTGVSGWLGARSSVAIPTLLLTFSIVRFLVGAGEAVAYPCANGIIGQWFGPTERALAAGVMFAGIGVGSALTPPLIAWIVVHWGWRCAFYVSATIGVLLALAIHLFMPKNQTDGLGLNVAPQGTPWKAIFTSKQVWALVISIFFFGYVTYVFFFWFYPYLVDVRKISLLRSSFFAAMPFLSMAIGAPLGGRLSDALVPRIGKTLARRRVAMSGLIAAAVLIPTGAVADSAFAAIACLSLGAGFVYVAISSYFATAVEIFPAHGATVSGTVNTGAGLGGVVAPILTPWIAQHFGWIAAIGSAGISCLIAAILWKFAWSGDRVEDGLTTRKVGAIKD